MNIKKYTVRVQNTGSVHEPFFFLFIFPVELNKLTMYRTIFFVKFVQVVVISKLTIIGLC